MDPKSKIDSKNNHSALSVTQGSLRPDASPKFFSGMTLEQFFLLSVPDPYNNAHPDQRLDSYAETESENLAGDQSTIHEIDEDDETSSKQQESLLLHQATTRQLTSRAPQILHSPHPSGLFLLESPHPQYTLHHNPQSKKKQQSPGPATNMRFLANSTSPVCLKQISNSNNASSSSKLPNIAKNTESSKKFVKPPFSTTTTVMAGVYLQQKGSNFSKPPPTTVKQKLDFTRTLYGSPVSHNLAFKKTASHPVPFHPLLSSTSATQPLFLPNNNSQLSPINCSRTLGRKFKKEDIMIKTMNNGFTKNLRTPLSSKREPLHKDILAIYGGKGHNRV